MTHSCPLSKKRFSPQGYSHSLFRQAKRCGNISEQGQYLTHTTNTKAEYIICVFNNVNRGKRGKKLISCFNSVLHCNFLPTVWCLKISFISGRAAKVISLCSDDHDFKSLLKFCVSLLHNEHTAMWENLPLEGKKKKSTQTNDCKVCVLSMSPQQELLTGDNKDWA